MPQKLASGIEKGHYSLAEYGLVSPVHIRPHTTTRVPQTLALHTEPILTFAVVDEDLLVVSSRKLAVALTAADAVGRKSGDPGALLSRLPSTSEAAPELGPGRARGLPEGLLPVRGRWRMPSSRRTRRMLAGSSSTPQPTRMRHSGQRSSWREHTMLSRQRRQKVCWQGSTLAVVSKRSRHTEHSSKSRSDDSSMASSLVAGVATCLQPPPLPRPAVVTPALRSSSGGGRLGHAPPGGSEEHGGGRDGRAQPLRSRCARRASRSPPPAATSSHPPAGSHDPEFAPREPNSGPDEPTHAALKSSALAVVRTPVPPGVRLARIPGDTSRHRAKPVQRWMWPPAARSSASASVESCCLGCPWGGRGAACALPRVVGEPHSPCSTSMRPGPGRGPQSWRVQPNSSAESKLYQRAHRGHSHCRTPELRPGWFLPSSPGRNLATGSVLFARASRNTGTAPIPSRCPEFLSRGLSASLGRAVTVAKQSLGGMPLTVLLASAVTQLANIWASSSTTLPPAGAQT